MRADLDPASNGGDMGRLSGMTVTTVPLRLEPDRLLPVEPEVRAIARRLYDVVRDLPVISPHGHVDPRVLLDDEPFPDPATLLVTSDPGVIRLLHASGIPLERLGVGQGPLSDAQARAVWRTFCERWDLFHGTPVRLRTEYQLVELFGVALRPSPHTADTIYDRITERLGRPDYRPRALYERFRISVLATCDDACSDLSVHAALEADPSWPGRIIPTFCPDAYLEPGPGWADRVARLGRTADVDTGDYAGFVYALERRRRFFVERGATSAAHSHPDVHTDPLEPSEANRIYRAALAGEATAAEAMAFRRHMLGEMARMSCDDGLVMTLHPGVRRQHHRPTFEGFGPDTGQDMPVPVEFTDALRPLLERYGMHPNLHLVLFTVDEGAWSRELAPLASFYPSVYLGMSWVDGPDMIRRFRAATMEVAGFSRSCGVVDDARALCSIPARHDIARRVDAGVLARLVAEDRLEEDEAIETAVDLVIDQPRRVFKLAPFTLPDQRGR
jgi:glucuronate isomerase